MAGFKSDRQIIRDYITANDDHVYDLLPEDVVAVTITHSNLSAKHLDIRINLHSTIADVKDKLRTHIGTPPEFQRLILKHNGNVLRELNDNSRMLGFYSPESGMEIHVIDLDPFSLSRNGGLTDVSLVEKFKISDEAYDKRKGTVRDWIRKKKAENPLFKPPKLGAAGQAPSAQDEEECGPETVAGVTVGARCEVHPGARRGTVQFVGPVEGLKPGHWVGVRLDEPLGLHDGSVKGTRFFEAAPGFGTFVKGRNVRVGDFPERDLLDSDDEAVGAAGGCEDAEEEDEETEI